MLPEIQPVFLGEASNVQPSSCIACAEIKFVRVRARARVCVCVRVAHRAQVGATVEDQKPQRTHGHVGR